MIRALLLMLFISQLGAEAHAYSHLVTDELGAPGTTQSCGKCLSFAPLLTAVGGTAPLVLVFRPEVTWLPSPASVGSEYRSVFYAFRSRAPPAPL